MKLFSIAAVVLLCLTFAAAQNEQSPIVERPLEYNDWVYPSVATEAGINLRTFMHGKKLVMVAYFAPWCPNWKHDAAFVQSMYEKYRASGFDVIGVGEYDPVDAMKKHIDQYKLTFPIVYESQLRTDKQKTTHYRDRRAAGDNRNWGSPWYVFLEVGKLEPGGPVLAKKLPIVNGELIKGEAENFIRERLGLAAGKSASTANITEVCTPDKKSAELLLP